MASQSRDWPSVNKNSMNPFVGRRNMLLRGRCMYMYSQSYSRNRPLVSQDKIEDKHQVVENREGINEAN
jgi:hypothetical protein